MGQSGLEVSFGSAILAGSLLSDGGKTGCGGMGMSKVRFNAIWYRVKSSRFHNGIQAKVCGDRAGLYDKGQLDRLPKEDKRTSISVLESGCSVPNAAACTQCTPRIVEDRMVVR